MRGFPKQRGTARDKGAPILDEHRALPRRRRLTVGNCHCWAMRSCPGFTSGFPKCETVVPSGRLGSQNLRRFLTSGLRSSLFWGRQYSHLRYIFPKFLERKSRLAVYVEVQGLGV